MNNLSLGLIISAIVPLVAMSAAMPSRSAEKVECGDGAKVQIVNGVIVCTVEKKVSKEVKCDEDIKLIKRIPVYYSEPAMLKEILDQIGVPCGSIIGVNTSPPSLTVSAPKNAIDTYQRRIAELDRPRERVNMEMWGIQISSADSENLASVMDQVNREIDHTRRAMQVTYEKLTALARTIKISDKTRNELADMGYSKLLESGTDGRQRLSLPDVLMRISLANEIPQGREEQIQLYNHSATNLCNFLAGGGAKDGEYSVLFAQYNQFEGRQQKEYELRRIITGATIPPFRRPFQRFQEVALHQQFPAKLPVKSQPKCDDGNINIEDKERKDEVISEWSRRQNTVWEFLKAYRSSQINPLGYNPSNLSTSASQLDGLMSPIADALNQDIEEYFIKPTLHRIKKIVGRYRNVEYAEVGRTTVTGLNGLLSTVSSTTSTSFDEPTPLRLNNLIDDAGKLKPEVDKLFPTLQNVPLSAGNPINASSAISLLAALSKEEVRWRAMSSGVTLNITPTVLRDRTAAQLLVDLTIADPAATNVSTSNENPLRTPSRISSSTLKTKVNVNTMDLFALSSFNNQTTVTGRRWYVPLIGPIWEGVFGDIPVVGNLFSPIRPPIIIQHQSIILANTLIVPTAMGLTEWYDVGVGGNTKSSPLLIILPQ